MQLSPVYLKRFLSKVIKTETCWIWDGTKNKKDGRAFMAVNGVTIPAARIAWSLFRGIPFPEDKLACHSCDNPSCVNPEHVWPGTHKDNMQDALLKGRLKIPNNGYSERTS